MNIACTIILPLLTLVIGYLIPRKKEVQTILVPAQPVPVKEYGLFMPPGCVEINLKGDGMSTYVNGDYRSMSIDTKNLKMKFKMPYGAITNTDIDGVVR